MPRTGMYKACAPDLSATFGPGKIFGGPKAAGAESPYLIGLYWCILRQDLHAVGRRGHKVEEVVSPALVWGPGGSRERQNQGNRGRVEAQSGPG